MQQFKTRTHNSSGNESAVENGNNHQRDANGPDVTLSATPSYDRAYNQFLTLEEAASGVSK